MLRVSQHLKVDTKINARVQDVDEKKGVSEKFCTLDLGDSNSVTLFFNDVATIDKLMLQLRIARKEML